MGPYEAATEVVEDFKVRTRAWGIQFKKQSDMETGILGWFVALKPEDVRTLSTTNP